MEHPQKNILDLFLKVFASSNIWSIFVRQKQTTMLNITYKYADNKFFKKATATVKIYKMEFNLFQDYTSIYMTDENGSILVDAYVDTWGELSIHSVSDKLFYFNVREAIVKALKLKK